MAGIEGSPNGQATEAVRSSDLPRPRRERQAALRVHREIRSQTRSRSGAPKSEGGARGTGGAGTLSSLRRVRRPLSGRVRASAQVLLLRRCLQRVEPLPSRLRRPPVERPAGRAQGLAARRRCLGAQATGAQGLSTRDRHLYNHAIDEDDVPLARSPARKLGCRTRSARSQSSPPTEAEFKRLLNACSALGDYAPRMRELLLFGAFQLPMDTLMLERWRRLTLRLLRSGLLNACCLCDPNVNRSEG